MNDYKQCCKDFMEKEFDKYTNVSTVCCPVCDYTCKPWNYLNKK